MNKRNESFEIRGIACLIFAVCGILFSVFSAQATTIKAVEPKASLLVPREVRVVTQNASAGQTITVVLEADAMGDESIYGFTLNYSTAVLTYVPNSVAIGSGATRQSGGLCDVLENANVAGRIGFSIDCNNSTITAGNNRRLVTMQFTVASNAQLGSTPLFFNDTPARRSVSSNPRAGAIMRLDTTFTDGNVNIISSTGPTRIVRVLNQSSLRNSTATVVLEADAAGDESIYGFTLNYDTAVLTYVPNSVAIGSGATRQAGGLCNVLENTDVAGRIGFSIDCGNSTITAGNNRRFVTIQFTVASTAPFGSSPLTFNDTPAQRRVSSNPQAGGIMDLPTTFANGFINISSPTAALIEISGKVALPRGRALNNAVVRLVTNNETLTARTNAFGFYRFRVRAGEICVLSVSHKRYQFASQVVTVLDAMNNLDFTAEP
ncbi:MAG: hypothetical protein H7Z37_12070 [Pyrinomonadaceae bacterium]|nr:hypothetical protein [Pyrinomonadaceae bacterium]